MINMDIKKHKKELLDILLFIYNDVDLIPALRFKGGTAAYFMYGLDRFSLYLDFNLLQKDKSLLIYNKLESFIQTRGKVKDSRIKDNTIFFLYNYESGERNMKIEISTRDYGDKFDLLSYLGMNIWTMRKEYMFAHKLVDLTDRKRTASRDLFDIGFFFNHQWDFNPDIIYKRTGTHVREYFKYLLEFIPEKFPDNKLLYGLGEFITEDQKKYVKLELKKSVLSHLKVYLELNK